jgi:predicted phosphodiesterase
LGASHPDVNAKLAMGKFFVLHASDLHLAKVPDRRGFPGWLDPRRLSPPTWLASHGSSHPEALARFVFEKKPDLVLITGDIATSGAPKNLSVASEFIDSQPGSTYFNAKRSPRPTLATANRALVPGNHDRFGAHFPYLPNNQAFEGKFGHYWPRSKSRVHTLAVLRHPTDSACLAVIGADFSLRKRSDANRRFVGYLGQGKVYDSTLTSLKAETKRVRKQFAPVAVLWVVHFAPKFPKVDQYLDLIDGSKLLSAAKELEVQYILCGHTHAASDYLPVPGVEVLCAGTAMEFGSKNQCIHMREFTVQSGQGQATYTQTRYNWDAATRQYR